MEQEERLKAALADRYAIEGEIGSGGMATVYLAQDLKHDRRVAVKVLRSDLAASLGAERFLQEVRVTANLTHPHILPLHDSGEADGFLFYVMPFIEGESLRDRLVREHELPVPEAARILRDVVDALAAAHKLGVVHRDIKPENVLLSGRHAMVADFGVAKAVSEATGRHKLTTLGVALGTPSYMAPEQAAADEAVDHRADIYAVGVLAYELLAGRPPFTGTTPQQILAAQVMEAPQPVTELRASVPPALQTLVMRCLEKKPADRWQSAEEMLPQLEAAATPSGGTTPTDMQPFTAQSTPRRTRWSLVGGAAVVVAALVAGTWIWSGKQGTTPGGALEPVLVVPFEVRSSAETLLGLGSAAAEQISAAILREDLAALASSTAVPATSDPETLREAVSSTGAATLVTGTIDHRGDSVEIRASVLRGQDLQPIYALEVERGSVNAPRTAIDAITQRVLGAVGWLTASHTRVQGQYRPPSSLETLRLIRRGSELFDERRFNESVPFYEEAFARDTSLLWVASGLVYAYWNAGRSRERDSILAYVGQRRSRLTHVETLYHNHAVEVHWGNPDDEYRTAVEALAPDTAWWLFNAMWSSVRSNRPEEGMRFFRMRDSAQTNLERWYDHSGRALHSLGRYEELLSHAREARQQGPTWPSALFWEARALAALGRLEELEDVLASAHLSDSPTAPGNALLEAGIQFWARGDTIAARELWQRTIDWVLAQGLEGEGALDRRILIANAYYHLGLYDQAREHLAILASASPENAGWAGMLARIAARQGDEDGAQAVAEELLTENRTWLKGAYTYEAAKIYAVLGHRERALALIRQAMNSGSRPWWDLKMSPRDFDSLRGHQPFEGLIQPKG